jgi:hypothetical protein
LIVPAFSEGRVIDMKVLFVIFSLIAVCRMVVRHRGRGRLTVEFAPLLVVLSSISMMGSTPMDTDGLAPWLGV